ncbi:MAG: sulfatase [Candidatus Sumerlaeota bacterium]|nr:sulfatase [Candidatus Sumerlaeota bacterium]
MPKSSRPNIIIFMMDTQGAVNMSCYGYRRKTTPNIDRLAKECCLFENHFVTDAWTLPVHASLFTGRYASGHGAGAQHEGLEPGLPSMAGVCGKAGYRTVAINNNYWAVNKTEWSAGKDFQEIIHYSDPRIPPVPPYVLSADPEERDKGALKGIGVALNWIDEHAKKSRKPFLMYFNAYDIHDPFHPPEPFRGRFLPEGVKYEKIRQTKSWQNPATIGDVCPTLDQWAALASLKDANTACVDDRLGKFVAALRERGVLDDTVFFITGDHGDCLGQHVGYAFHSQNGAYDHVCRTPLIVRYPQLFKPASRCRELVQIVDVFPTLIEIAGIRDKEAEARIAGKSLLAALHGPVREFALMESQRSVQTMRITWTTADDIDNADPRFMNVAYKAARTKRYKYIWASNGNDMLFDVVKDPDERWNIIQSKSDIAATLRKSMEQMLMSMEQRYYPDMMTPDRQIRFPAETITHALRRLAAWGLYQPGVVPAWDGEAKEKAMERLDEWGKKRRSLLEHTE